MQTHRQKTKITLSPTPEVYRALRALPGGATRFVESVYRLHSDRTDAARRYLLGDCGWTAEQLAGALADLQSVSCRDRLRETGDDPGIVLALDDLLTSRALGLEASHE